MNKQTHWNMARLIFGKMEELHPQYKWNGLRRIMFYFGAIEPDLSVAQFFHPHYYEKSADYIYMKINKVQEKDKDGMLKAYELGKIVHYLCDFCCHAHISGGIGGAIEHIHYECRINKYFIENFNKFEAETVSKTVEQPQNSDIGSYIDKRIKEYKIARPSYYIDIEKSMEISATLLNVLCNEKAVLKKHKRIDVKMDQQYEVQKIIESL